MAEKDSKIDPRKFKLLKEVSSHYEVQHPDGSSFKVAKKPLDSKTHEFIRALSFAGDEDNPQASVVPQISDFDPNTANMSVQGSQPAMSVQSPDSGGQDSSPTAATQDQGDTSGPAISSDSTLPNKPTLPAQSDQPQALSLQEEALQHVKNIDQKYGTAFAGSYEQAQQQSQGLDQSIRNYQQEYTRTNALRDKLENDIANKNIDPNGWWHQKDTPGKIMAGLGMIMSGIGAGVGGHPELAMDFVNRQISNDIDAQKANFTKKDSLLKSLYLQSGDIRRAELEARDKLLSATKDQINIMAAQTNEPQKRADLMLTNMKIAQAQLEYGRSAAMFKEMSKWTGHGSAAINPLLFPKEMKDTFIKYPAQPGQPDDLYGAALKPELADKANTKNAHIVGAKQRLLAYKNNLLNQIAFLPGGAAVPEAIPLIGKVHIDLAKSMGEAKTLGSQSANALAAALNNTDRPNNEMAKEIAENIGNGVGITPGRTIDQINYYLNQLDEEQENTRKQYDTTYKGTGSQTMGTGRSKIQAPVNPSKMFHGFPAEAKGQL